MNRAEIKNSNFIIKQNCSIKEAMEAITDNHRGTVIIVDNDFIFQGIVADGDIRRAILRGATEMTPVIKIANQNPIVLYEDNEFINESHKIFKEDSSINTIPILDKNNKVIDIIVRKKS